MTDMPAGGEDFILVLDQGSSSSRTLVFDLEGKVRFKAQRKLEAAYPAQGLAEYDAEEIFRTQKESLSEVLSKLPPGSKVLALSVAAQRSTVVFWDKRSGAPLCPALSWQDGRALELLSSVGLSNRKIHDATGLYKTPYYSASKIAWCLKNYPAVKKAAEEKNLLISPVAGFLLWKFSNGSVFALDPGQAQRTLLFNIRRLKWDKRLLEAFGVPPECLPEVRPSFGDYGRIETDGFTLPVRAMLGDQQAAMLGLGVEGENAAALNYGTGAFLLVNTGATPVKIRGLLNSVGWQTGRGKKSLCYFTESTVNSAGTALEWLKVKFNLFDDINDVDGMCRKSKNRLFCLPAIGGIGSPYWDFSAFTTFTGFSAGSDKYDVVRGMVEGVAFMVGDSLDLVKRKGFKIDELKVSGGLSKIDWLLQFQADITGAKVLRLEEAEATAAGAALAAARSIGLNPSWKIKTSPREFAPQLSEEERQKLIKSWRAFVKATRKTSQALRRLGALPHA
ncbi:MAG: FGGY family carbohydrate kinase [Elusimicrobia bacterium]|nr:FGGY family carbohydrate kinase [Elusimicrobiota bacterium]